MEYLPSYKDSLYLEHHGVLGMKWGVRRYQNADGSLTEAGRKRYYGSDGRLTKAGHRYNRRAETNVRGYANSTAYNIRVHPDYADTIKRFEKVHNADAAARQKADVDYENGSKYKGLDYYQYRDKLGKEWTDSKLGKEQAKVEAKLKDIVTETAKEHPLFDKTYKKLKDVDMTSITGESNFKTVNYGEEVVNRVLQDILYLHPDRYIHGTQN